MQNDYFLWLCGLVEGVPDRSRKLEFLKYLHEKVYYSDFPNDGNRADDGKSLREKYFYWVKHDEDYPVWGDPCSVLEMLVALSGRIDFILYDPDKGDRTSL